MTDKMKYLAEIVAEMKKLWPQNRTVNIVCHGHSVPSGYFSTPMVDTFNAYPHLLHLGLKARFPFSVVNVIVTAIGGENSEKGSARFERDVLCHQPDVVTIDYGLNDRGLGLEKARVTWEKMIESALARGIKVLLLTPTADVTQAASATAEVKKPLQDHAAQIRGLAEKYKVGLVDSLATFETYQRVGDLSDLLSWQNHPNRRGHELVAQELMRWFLINAG